MKLPQQSPSPPQWANKLLEWLCPDELLEEVQGDLQELFEERAAEAGEKQARREYVLVGTGLSAALCF
jgi:putative ABC transport system permease protein